MAETSVDTKILTGDDILLIKQTSLVRDYKADAKPGFAGKQYRVYAFGDKAFAVHQDDAFHKDFEAGQLYKVMLTVTDEGWSLANHITFKQAIGQKRNTLILESLTITDFAVDMASLLNATA